MAKKNTIRLYGYVYLTWFWNYLPKTDSEAPRGAKSQKKQIEIRSWHTFTLQDKNSCKIELSSFEVENRWTSKQ